MGREAKVMISLYQGGRAQNSKEPEDMGDMERAANLLLVWLEEWFKKNKVEGQDVWMSARGSYEDLDLVFRWISGPSLLRVLNLYLESNPSLILEVSYYDEYDRSLGYRKFIGPAVTTDSLYYTLNILYEAQDRVESIISNSDPSALTGTEFKIPKERNKALEAACSNLLDD